MWNTNLGIQVGMWSITKLWSDDTAAHTKHAYFDQNPKYIYIK